MIKLFLLKVAGYFEFIFGVRTLDNVPEVNDDGTS